jgi:hypothetical protein
MEPEPRRRPGQVGSFVELKIAGTLFILLLVAIGLSPADPAVLFSRGTWHGALYACAVVDPRRAIVDLATFGRKGDQWTSAYGSLEAIGSCRAAINGTFFSLRWSQPAGILVYDDGRQQWTPRFKRDYDGVPREVSTLRRGYLAVLKDGRVAVGNSQGRSVTAVRLGVRGPIRCLVGGLGLLVEHGRRAVSGASLEDEGFDELSGLRPVALVPRSAIGIDRGGRLILAVGGVGGQGMSLDQMADLMVARGAHTALFLDCGSSTQMRVGDWRCDSGRALPTWIVIR